MVDVPRYLLFWSARLEVCAGREASANESRGVVTRKVIPGLGARKSLMGWDG